jgi:ATP-dependent helicase YprA (DUF1998 family)
MPIQSKLADPEVSITPAHLRERALEILGKLPFEGQLDGAIHILNGDDLILVVGTGNGKTLVSQLPLLCHSKYINLIISPLSALMIEQVRVKLEGSILKLNFI